MILSLHQPQYLAWIGYFHKILKSDTFVFLDNVQYKKREYQNRNRIRTKNGVQWLTVPVVKSPDRFIKIKDVLVDNSQDWAARHWKALYLNYNHSPYFKEYSDFFHGLYGKKWEKLLDLNIYIIKGINKFLNINKDIYLESGLGINNTKTARIIDICGRLGADTYLSGMGGKAYLEEDLFMKAGLRLKYQKFSLLQYPQRYMPFIPNLSILDLLFNCGKESARILEEC
ncbi:MAG: WbqC family protein [Candidatus Omnitrophica bacterium]|nr:WbqC family protein [Candidatus Omnitrophota bacterium]